QIMDGEHRGTRRWRWRKAAEPVQQRVAASPDFAGQPSILPVSAPNCASTRNRSSQLVEALARKRRKYRFVASEYGVLVRLIDRRETTQQALAVNAAAGERWRNKKHVEGNVHQLATIATG